MERRKKIPWQGQQVDAIELSFQPSGEHWNEYLADDGAVLRQKTVATEILRLVDQYDNEGNPVYVIKSASLVSVSAPDKLCKPPQAGG